MQGVCSTWRNPSTGSRILVIQDWNPAVYASTPTLVFVSNTTVASSQNRLAISSALPYIVAALPWVN